MARGDLSTECATLELSKETTHTWWSASRSWALVRHEITWYNGARFAVWPVRQINGHLKYTRINLVLLCLLSMVLKEQTEQELICEPATNIIPRVCYLMHNTFSCRPPIRQGCRKCARMAYGYKAALTETCRKRRSRKSN